MHGRAGVKSPCAALNSSKQAQTLEAQLRPQSLPSAAPFRQVSPRELFNIPYRTVSIMCARPVHGAVISKQLHVLGPLGVRYVTPQRSHVDTRKCGLQAVRCRSRQTRSAVRRAVVSMAAEQPKKILMLGQNRQPIVTCSTQIRVQSTWHNE